MGTKAWRKERRRTGWHICLSAGGGHRGPQRLLAGNDGRQGWLEKESHGSSTEIDLVVVVVVGVAAAAVVVVVVVAAAAAAAVVVVVVVCNQSCSPPRWPSGHGIRL